MKNRDLIRMLFDKTLFACCKLVSFACNLHNAIRHLQTGIPCLQRKLFDIPPSMLAPGFIWQLCQATEPSGSLMINMLNNFDSYWAIVLQNSSRKSLKSNVTLLDHSAVSVEEQWSGGQWASARAEHVNIRTRANNIFAYANCVGIYSLIDL